MLRVPGGRPSFSPNLGPDSGVANVALKRLQIPRTGLKHAPVT